MTPRHMARAFRRWYEPVDDKVTIPYKLFDGLLDLLSSTQPKLTDEYLSKIKSADKLVSSVIDTLHERFIEENNAKD